MAQPTSSEDSPDVLRLITIATPDSCQTLQIPEREKRFWPVPTSCRWRDWKTVPGRIPRGFHLAADGVVTARLLATKANFRRRTCWKHSATSAMPAVAVGRRHCAFGMRCDSQFPPRVIPRCLARRAMPLPLPLAFFFSVMFANEIIGRLNMAIWNSTCRGRCGCGGTTMRAFRRWRSVFWSRT
jgi:hypothetical protein